MEEEEEKKEKGGAGGEGLRSQALTGCQYECLATGQTLDILPAHLLQERRHLWVPGMIC